MFLFLHAAQLHPLRSAHLAKSPHGPRDAVRDGTKGANKPGPLRIRNAFHNYRPARPANPKQNLRRGNAPGSGLRRRLHHRLYRSLGNARRRLARRCWPAGGRPDRPPGAATTLVAAGIPPVCPPRCSCGCHIVVSAIVLETYALRLSIIIRSLLRFLRVFAPNVENPHGVCG